MSGLRRQQTERQKDRSSEVVGVGKDKHTDEARRTRENVCEARVMVAVIVFESKSVAAL